MSRALFVNIPAHGHVNPTLPLVAELAARGEQVDYALTADFEPAVRGAGARLLPFESLLPGAISFVSAASGSFMLPARLVQEAIQVLPQLVDAVAADPPDYVVHDPFSIAGRLLADRLGVPAIQTHCTYVFSDASLRHPAFRRIAQWAPSTQTPREFEEASRELARRFGVDPPGMRDLFLHAAPFNIVFLPRAFQPGGEDFDQRWAFVGPSIGVRPGGNESEPRARIPGPDGPHGPDGLGALEGLGDGPLLFVSLGTVFNDHAPFFRTCLDAFGETPWRVLLSVGERVDVDELGAIPRNAVVRRHVPQLEVLAHASVFVSHGGMNSTMESIVAEVPLVVVPQQPEQGVTAERVTELGLGTHLDPEQVDASSLAQAVSSVVADEGVRSRLAAMRQAAAEAGGPQRAAEEILAHVR